jgi:hypothetical protein
MDESRSVEQIVTEFVGRLNDVLVAAGPPSRPELARLAVKEYDARNTPALLPTSTVDDILCRRRKGLPQWLFVKTLVIVCRAAAAADPDLDPNRIGTVQEWRAWYEEAAQQITRAKMRSASGSADLPDQGLPLAAPVPGEPGDGRSFHIGPSYGGEEGLLPDRGPAPGPAVLPDSPVMVAKVDETELDRELRVLLGGSRHPLTYTDEQTRQMLVESGLTGHRLLRQLDDEEHPEHGTACYETALLMLCAGVSDKATQWLSRAGTARHRDAVDLLLGDHQWEETVARTFQAAVRYEDQGDAEGAQVFYRAACHAWKDHAHILYNDCSFRITRITGTRLHLGGELDAHQFPILQGELEATPGEVIQLDIGMLEFMDIRSLGLLVRNPRITLLNTPPHIAKITCIAFRSHRPPTRREAC